MKRNKEMAAKAEKIFGKVSEIIEKGGAWVEMDDRISVVNACNAIGIYINGGAFYINEDGGASCYENTQYFYI